MILRKKQLVRPGMAVALLAFVCGCGGPGESGGGPSPASAPRAKTDGIVLLTVDGLVLGETSASGGATATPNLARLVSGGRAWTAWTASPVTRPAVATYLTGRPPRDHGVWNNVYTSLSPEVPTVVGVLAAAGYRTAAFPDSSHVGYSSGLLDDFQVVDEPPPAPTSVLRWLPAVKDPAEQGDNFAAWLGTVGDGEPFFAWMHLSGPFLRRFGPLGQEPGDIAPFDALVGRVLDAAAARGATVILAGTYGEAAGGAGTLPGPGLSVADSSVAVPVIVTGPGLDGWRSADALVAAADVAATIADLTGTGLTTVGVPLTRDVPSERAVFSWSRGPRDQFGWLPIGAARQGSATLRVGAGVAAETAGDPTLVAQLEQALGRQAPPPPQFDAIDEVTALLEQSGLTIRAVPAEGRTVSAPARLAVAGAVWNARVALYHREWQDALGHLDTALKADPEALSPLLDRGQLLLAMQQAGPGNALVARATELYPGDVETVHWYAHGIWAEHLEIAEPLLAAILPERLQDPDLLYDMACARTLDGDLDAGDAYLRDAIEAGYRDWEHMETDADLRALRESGRFATLMREYRR